MRARGLAVLAVLLGTSSMAACSASPGGNSFSDDKNGNDDDKSDSGWHPGQGGNTNPGGGTLLPDGGELLPDGAVITPPKGDGGFLGDGAAPTSRLSCGSSYCRGDQTCNAGSCQFACVGTNVPGDYATIQSAINATINGGSDVTICLKAQTYSEAVSISGSPTTPKNVTIQGVSAGSTTVNSLSVSGATPFSALTIRGVGFTGTVQISSVTAPVSLIGDKIASSSTYGLYDYDSSDVTADGCDIAASASYYAVYFYPYYNGPAQKLTVRNSYIHDSAYGLYVSTGSYSGSATGTLSFVNDTFNNNTTAVYTYGAGMPVTFTNANNLIVNSKTYGIDQESSSTTVTSKNNALFGNVNNYAGSAVDGVGYVKADVKLDTAQIPPGLGASSPARGVADGAMAPSTDFWGVARASSTDIGAVQN